MQILYDNTTFTSWTMIVTKCTEVIGCTTIDSTPVRCSAEIFAYQCKENPKFHPCWQALGAAVQLIYTSVLC